jgi:hypothetical protein
MSRMRAPAAVRCFSAKAAWRVLMIITLQKRGRPDDLRGPKHFRGENCGSTNGHHTLFCSTICRPRDLRLINLPAAANRLSAEMSHPFVMFSSNQATVKRGVPVGTAGKGTKGGEARSGCGSSALAALRRMFPSNTHLKPSSCGI